MIPGKYIYISLAMTAITALFNSCVKCRCETASYITTKVVNYSGAVDTSAKVEVFVKGSGFLRKDHTIASVKIDSLENGLGILDYYFDLNHDYKITLLSRGKEYMLKDIVLKDNTEEQLIINASCKKCYDRITYIFNDTVYSYWVNGSATVNLY